jgi:uncharacterized protein (DUF2141 family)
MSYLIVLLIHFFSAGIFNKDLKDLDKVNNGINLIINNIKNNKGVIQIGFFNSENGYPDKPTFSFTLAKDTIHSGKLRMFIPVQKSGAYVITILDDENKNGKMDFIFGIKPKEGFGFSNNPRVPGRKPPPFNDACINYSEGVLIVSVNMKYI